MPAPRRLWCWRGGPWPVGQRSPAHTSDLCRLTGQGSHCPRVLSQGQEESGLQLFQEVGEGRLSVTVWERMVGDRAGDQPSWGRCRSRPAPPHLLTFTPYPHQSVLPRRAGQTPDTLAATRATFVHAESAGTTPGRAAQCQQQAAWPRASLAHPVTHLAGSNHLAWTNENFPLRNRKDGLRAPFPTGWGRLHAVPQRGSELVS